MTDQHSAAERADAQSEIRPDEPHGARIWNYWLGGTDNFPPDREVGDAVRAAWPEIAEAALTSRQFLIRAVRYLAQECGIDQFLDIGTGLPTMQNTHQVAQAIQPRARVVYVDNDPLVLAHARTLLGDTSADGVTAYLHGDYREPEKIVVGARNMLDFERPIAVMFMGVLGYVPDAAEAGSFVARVMSTVPEGSYLALWDGTDTSESARAGAKAQADAGSPYYQRRVEQIERWFDGLTLVEPGVVSISQWRLTADPVAGLAAEPVDGYGAVARKP